MDAMPSAWQASRLRADRFPRCRSAATGGGRCFAGQSRTNLQARPDRRGASAGAGAADHLGSLGQCQRGPGRSRNVLSALHEELERGIEFAFAETAAGAGAVTASRGRLRRGPDRTVRAPRMISGSGESRHAIEGGIAFSREVDAGGPERSLPANQLLNRSRIGAYTVQRAAGVRAIRGVCPCAAATR